LTDVRIELLPGEALRGRPRYVIEDFAFDFLAADVLQEKHRKGGAGTSSLVAGTLQVEVSVDQGVILFVWGYCPYLSWRSLSISPPSCKEGILRIIRPAPLVAGVSLGIDSTVSPAAYFDPLSGWLRLGAAEMAGNATAVEFATDSIAAMKGGQLVSIWVRPENWRDVASRVRERPPAMNHLEDQ